MHRILVKESRAEVALHLATLALFIAQLSALGKENQSRAGWKASSRTAFGALEGLGRSFFFGGGTLLLVGY